MPQHTVKEKKKKITKKAGSRPKQPKKKRKTLLG